jgi:hypothetical protein
MTCRGLFSNCGLDQQDEKVLYNKQRTREVKLDDNLKRIDNAGETVKGIEGWSVAVS